MSDITLENAGVAFVGTDAGELAFTNAGTFHLSHVLYVAGGTNSPVGLTNVPQGTVVVLDVGNSVNVMYGPNLPVLGMRGFTTAVEVIGLLLLIRFFGGMLLAAISENFSRGVD